MANIIDNINSGFKLGNNLSGPSGNYSRSIARDNFNALGKNRNITGDNSRSKTAEEYSFDNFLSGTNASGGTNGTIGGNGNNGLDLSSGTNASGGTNGTIGGNGNNGLDLSSGTNASGGTNGTIGGNGNNGLDLSSGTNASGGTNGTIGGNGNNGLDLSSGTNASGGTLQNIGISTDVLDYIMNIANGEFIHYITITEESLNDEIERAKIEIEKLECLRDMLNEKWYDFINIYLITGNYYTDLYYDESGKCLSPDEYRNNAIAMERYLRDNGYPITDADNPYSSGWKAFEEYVEEKYTPIFNKYFKNSVGVSYDTFLKGLNEIDENILEYELSIYSNRQQIKLIPYMELTTTSSYQQFVNEKWNLTYYEFKSLELSSKIKKEVSYLTVEDAKIFFYLYETQGLDEASKYLDANKDSINHAKGKEEAEELLADLNNDSSEILKDIKATIGGVGDGIQSWFRGWANLIAKEGVKSPDDYKMMYLFQTLSTPGKRYLDNLINELAQTESFRFGCSVESIKSSYNFYYDDGTINSDYAKEKLSTFQYENLINAINSQRYLMEYEFGTALGNQLPTAIISFIVSKVATPIVGKALAESLGKFGAAVGTFGSSAGNAKMAALIEGNSLYKSTIYGVVSGLSEAVLERILSNIPGVGEVAEFSIKGIIKNGFEETLQTFVNAGFKAWYLGEDIDLDKLSNEARKAFIYGMAVSGVMTGGVSACNIILSGTKTTISNLGDLVEFVRRENIDMTNSVDNTNIVVKSHQEILDSLVSKYGKRCLILYCLAGKIEHIPSEFRSLIQEIPFETVNKYRNGTLNIGIQYFAESSESIDYYVDKIRSGIEAMNQKYGRNVGLYQLYEYIKDGHKGNELLLSNAGGFRNTVMHMEYDTIVQCYNIINGNYSSVNNSDYMGSISTVQLENNMKSVVSDFINNGRADANILYNTLITTNVIEKNVPSNESYSSFETKFSNITTRQNGWNHTKTNDIEISDIGHRLYINADFDVTYKFLELFADKCQARGIGFYFKTAADPYDAYNLARSESAVIYSSEKNIVEYTEICREIKNEYPELQFYLPPVATSSIDGWLGYGAEPTQQVKQKLESEGLKNISFNNARAYIIDKSIDRGINSYVNKFGNIKIRRYGKTVNQLYIDALYYSIIQDYNINDTNTQNQLYQHLQQFSDDYGSYLLNGKDFYVRDYYVKMKNVNNNMYYYIESDNALYDCINTELKNTSNEYGIDSENFALNDSSFIYNNANIRVIDQIHGFQLNADDFGVTWKADIKRGFYTQPQVDYWLNTFNQTGYISESTGNYFSSLCNSSDYNIYVKTVHSTHVQSIMEEGIRCLGNSTSGYGNVPKNISDINLEDSISNIDGTYELLNKLKNAKGKSQGGNETDGTIILKIPKNIDYSDIFYFSQKSGCFCIKPQYVDSFCSVDSNRVVSEPILNNL